jgi:hypothetical protein
MNITELPEEKKSQLLARLAGWEITRDGTRAWIESPDFRHTTTNLYDPLFAFLAFNLFGYLAPEILLPFGDWWRQENLFLFWIKSAQRSWLNKILSLAFEAGMITDIE